MQLTSSPSLVMILKKIDYDSTDISSISWRMLHFVLRTHFFPFVIKLLLVWKSFKLTSLGMLRYFVSPTHPLHTRLVVDMTTVTQATCQSDRVLLISASPQLIYHCLSIGRKTLEANQYHRAFFQWNLPYLLLLSTFPELPAKRHD